MELKIRNYIKNDLKYIKKITQSSFTLTSFNIDKNISRKKSLEIIWKIWGLPALKKDGFKPCLTALCNDRVVGFLIYGYNSKLSTATGIKFGSIILLAVLKKYSDSGIATLLLKKLDELFIANRIEYVGVGTDLSNIAACSLYQKTGFRLISPWVTMKYYMNRKSKIKKPKENIKEINNLSNAQTIVKGIDRPNAIIDDVRINKKAKKKLILYLKNNILRQFKENKIKILKSRAGWISLNQDINISGMLRKKYYRINDLVSEKEKDLAVQIDNILYYINEIAAGKECIIEYFLRLSPAYYSVKKVLDHNKKMEILINKGFIPGHFAISLMKKY